MKKKIKKLITKPGIFFRDYFNKRYPVINNELGCAEEDELAIIQHTLSQEQNLPKSVEDFPVDIVYTWVNQNKQWKKELNCYKEKEDGVGIGQYGTNEARFDDHNELYYSIKSVQQYIPWIRNIYVVTNNRYDLPEHLLIEGITIITHDEIIDAEYLPTFNSHVIEAFLHKIPGLSEHFIYFNDDVFVARNLPKEHFFQPNGLAALFLSSKHLDEMYDKGRHTPTLLASLYSQKLLAREFGYYINHPLVHTYVPLKRGVYKSAWELYGEEIRGFLKNRFRGSHDINMATFLVPWLMYILRYSSARTDVCYYFNIRSPHARSQYEKLLQKKEDERPHSICANDFILVHSQRSAYDYKENLSYFLEKYFNKGIQ